MSARWRCSVARVGNRVQPVERVRDVDEAALLADRGDRVAEAHAARDLALEEEPDHLALVVGLHLLAGDHDEVAAARVVDRLERAAEDVVVGDGDRAEPFGLGVVDELGRRRCAVVRPRGVHVQVGDDPRAVRERLGLRAGSRRRAAERGVERLELGGDVRRRSAPRPRRAPRRPRARAARRPRRAARPRRRRAPAGSRRRAAGRSRSRRPAPRASRGAARRRRARRSRPRSGAPRAAPRRARCARGRAARGRAGSRAARSAGACAAARPPSPASSRSARITPRATARSFGRSSTTIASASRPARRASCRRRARAAVVAGEALARRLAHVARTARQRVEPRRAASRAATAPVGSRAGPARRRSRPRARRCRGARGTRATAAPARSRGRRRTRPARARARGSPARRPGTPSCERREIGIAGPRAITSGRLAARERAPPGEQIGRARRRREHRDLVPARRRAAATPATWSFTSCGCDQANGVTRQIRIDGSVAR